MRENKWILSVLIVGLLLCGLGGGIMFVEFTGLNYGGEYIIQTDTPETKIMEVSLQEFPEGIVHVSTSLVSMFPLKDRIRIDEKMEEGLIRVETVFDPENVHPAVELEPIFGQENRDTKDAILWINYYSRETLSSFFLVKDMILEDLKNSTLRSYRTVDVMDLTVTVGPKTAQRLIFN